MAKPINVTLSRKADADLISFFKQQNMRAATLVLIALYSYIKGEPVNLELLPVTVTEQTKRLNIYVAINENGRKKEIKKEIISFISGIPQGLLSVYIKGILRYTFGSCIYQTETTTFPKAASEIHITTPEFPDEPSSYQKEEFLPIEDISSSDGNDDDDDVFDLLESLLG